MLILCSSFISLLSVLCLIHFLYSWLETLDRTLSQTKFLTLPPNPVFQNSSHRQFILIKYVVSRWSSGNRERATSAREVIEVAGSNHAIGVILNLAWGPNNFSPSMIWSWRTRSNSRTGLGAEWLLPAKSAFFFYHLFYIFPLIRSFYIFVFHFCVFLFSGYSVLFCFFPFFLFIFIFLFWNKIQYFCFYLCYYYFHWFTFCMYKYFMRQVRPKIQFWRKKEVSVG